MMNSTMHVRFASLAAFPFVFLLVGLCAGTELQAQWRYTYDVKNGIDVLLDQDLAPLHGKRVALVSNQTGRTRTLQSTLDVIADHKQVTLTAVMTPEHGYYGVARAGEEVQDSVMPTIRDVPAYSLYAGSRRPAEYMLDSCDMVVFDIQDVGVRSYTYLGTLYHVMDACAEFGVPLMVLDRPNPLGGETIDGNVLDSAIRSFVGIVPVPYIHGMTFGELAQMINGEGWLPTPEGDSTARRCELEVISMANWERWMLWEDTDFRWIPTSPHVPSVDAIRGMAMLGIFGELSLMNIGVGYTLPFQMFGMPNFNHDFYNELIRTKKFPGIELVPTEFRPFYGKYAREDCRGYLLRFYNDINFRPYTSGVELVLALRKTHPELFDAEAIAEDRQAMFAKVTGSEVLFEKLYNRATDLEIRQLTRKGADEFALMREPYLLYQ